MQQTETYKLNLIESSDTFSPEALNANTRKVEEAMLAHEEKVDGQVADLDTRVTVLEGFKFACGSYDSRLATNFSFELGFRPKAVIIASSYEKFSMVMSTDAEGGDNIDLKLTDTGFFIKSKYTNGPNSFLAFG